MAFHYINENVKPLRAALAQATAELKVAMEKLNSLRNRLAVSLFQQCSTLYLFRFLYQSETMFSYLRAQELQKVLDVLSEKMSVALIEKQKCQDEADTTAFIIDLANRLINGLASENIRWAETAQLYVGLPLHIIL